MTPRENLLAMYRREGYRHAPVGFELCPTLQAHYKSIAGDTPMAEYFDYPEGFAVRHVPGLRMQAREPVDWSVFYNPPLKPGTQVDDYGVAHEPGSEAAKHMSYMRHPLARAASIDDLRAYPLPRWDTENVGHVHAAVAEAHAAGLAAVAHMACTIWERSWYLRDMTQLMMDMTMEDEKAVFLLDTITEDSCQRAAAFARAGVDIIELGDDVGMQQTIMMSKTMYDEWLKPRLARKQWGQTSHVMITDQKPRECG